MHPVVFVAFFIVVPVTHANYDDHHDDGCSGDTEYNLVVTFPWNRRSIVMPRYHLTINNLAIIVHNDRFKLWKDGRKAGAGLAAFIETGTYDVFRAELGYDGDLIETSQMNKTFGTNVTVSYLRRFVSVIGRVARTPDWFVASKPQDLCNVDVFYADKEEWKLGDYRDVILLDAGTYITPTHKNARPRPVKPVMYSKEGGYVVSKDMDNSAAVGVVNARRRACPTFGTQAYPVGAEWQDGPCTTCRCLDTNRDSCIRQSCPPPPCEYFIFRNDVCCPVCQDQKAYLAIVEKARNPDPPVIVKKPHNVTVVLGGTVTLDCTAWGDPKPQLQLLKNNPDEFVHVHRSPDHPTEPGLSSVILKIDYMTRGDIGRYTCFANSVGGDREEHAYITIKF